jgi:hypothetical protein
MMACALERSGQHKILFMYILTTSTFDNLDDNVSIHVISRIHVLCLKSM